MKDHAKEPRFRRPEFQRKLKKASMYSREIGSTEEPGAWYLARMLFSRKAAFLYLLIFLAAVYYLVFSPYFLVKKVALTTAGVKAEAVAAVLQELATQRTFFIPRNHLLLLNSQSFFPVLQKELPEVKRITYFRRHWPDWLEVGIEQREARYVWQSGLNYYFLDQDGIAFAKLPDYLPRLYPQGLIVDRSGAAVKLGQSLKIARQLAFVNELKREWPKAISQTSIASFSVPAVLSGDLFVKTSTGFEVYFDLERPVSDELGSLKLLLAEAIKPETYNGLAYIDVRLPNVAYYCYKDAACAETNESGIKN